MDQDFEWSPTDLQDIKQKHGDLPAHPTQAEVAAHYDKTRNVINRPTINASTPTMPSIPLARIVRGTVIAGSFAGALAIGASVVMAIVDAVFVFVSTNALAIGGGFVGLVVVYLMVEGKRVASGGSGQPSGGSGGNHYHYYYQNNSFGGDNAGQQNQAK